MSKGKKKSISDEAFLLTNDIPFSIQEAYKILRTNILYSMSSDKCKVIVVTSAEQHDGKSATAINLALSMVDNSQRVLLIDGDLRMPVVAQRLKLLNRPGVTNYVYGMNDYEDIIQVHESGLHVIAAGVVPPNPSETLSSDRMFDLIDYAAAEYDYIIIDSPPVGLVTDAAILSKYASGVILVARQGHTREDNIDKAIEQLEMTEANILGFVMTGTSVVNNIRKKVKKRKS